MRQFISVLSLHIIIGMRGNVKRFFEQFGSRFTWIVNRLFRAKITHIDAEITIAISHSPLDGCGDDDCRYFLTYQTGV